MNDTPSRDEPENRISDSEAQSGSVSGYAHVITQYPVASLLAGFGVGFSLGVLATAIFSHQNPRARRHNQLRDSFQELSTSLGKLPHLLAEHLPSSLVHRK